MRLRLKLFLLALGLIGLSVLVAYGYASRRAEEEERRRIESDLVVRLELARHELEGRDLTRPVDVDWDRIADELGRAARARVSIISPTGRVLGDSMLGPEELATADDHRYRPEIQGALEGNVGSADRYSRTTRSRMLYVATPLKTAGEVVGVVRLALPTTAIDETLSGLRRVLLVAAMLALVTSLLVAGVFVQLVSEPLSALTGAAKRMAAGDLEVRARTQGRGELAQLGDALDQLARSLSSSLADLRQERDRIAGILSSMAEGVLFLDEAGKVVLINPALRKMLLLSGDPVGRSLLEVVRHAELKEMVDAAMDGDPDDDEDAGDGSIQGEIRIGGLLPRQLLVRVQRLEGAARGVVGVFMDVTETRRLENLRKEFVANVSHELRTPVTSIRSATETLVGSADVAPEMRRRFLDIIDRNAARLHALVEDLLDLSRIESRQFSLTIGPLEPEQVLAHVVSLFEDRAARRQITLELDISAELPAVRADRRALEHVISNLVDNAVKYAGTGKRVALLARQEGDAIEFVVRDDGTGIEQRHLSRLFERFYRVDAGRSRDLGGTGLGLAIVKHLVESMQGKVRVESEVGRGTAFFVRLPAVPVSRRPPPALQDAGS